MKKLLTILFIFAIAVTSAQEKQPTYEVVNDMVKATYYYEDGKVKEQGFFKDKKLEGVWMRFNKEGKKTAIAHYKAGKKVGKWFLWNKNTLTEINYNNNTIASVNTWKQDTRVAVKHP